MREPDRRTTGDEVKQIERNEPGNVWCIPGPPGMFAASLHLLGMHLTLLGSFYYERLKGIPAWRNLR